MTADTPPTDQRDRHPEARARALQSLLTERGLLSDDAVEAVIATYEEDVGPMTGATVVARAWTDPEFKRRLLDDGISAVAELDVSVEDEVMELRVVENTPAYRSRAVDEPRALLREEFDTDLPDDVEVAVWDSNSEIRYMVLPQRPPGTEDLDEAELRELVTRNAMIGVERLA
jgi:nitrile hydratase